MTRFILRWAVNAIALYVAILLVNNTVGGILLQNPHWTSFIWMGLIFGFVNALLRPIISFLTCPLIILTLGLFTLLINTFLFYVVGYLGTFFNVGYQIESFWSAFLAAVVISIVSVLLSIFIKDNRRRSRRRKS
jgi:putative membrane protein